MITMKVVRPEGVEMYGKGHFAQDECFTVDLEGEAEALETAGHAIRVPDAPAMPFPLSPVAGDDSAS